MIPSKAKDFTAAHGGFKGEQKRLSDLLACAMLSQMGEYCYYFRICHTSPAGGGAYRLTHILERIGPDQSPSDGL